MFAKKKSNNIEILSEEEINNLLQESDMISTGEKDDDLLAEIFGVGAENPPLPSPGLKGFICSLLSNLRASVTGVRSTRRVLKKP